MKKVIGFAYCGSFCTFRKTTEALRLLAEEYEIQPIFSRLAYSTDTRFGTAAAWRQEVEEICGREIWSTAAQVEPIGPKKLLELLVIAPCTGNTLGKLACGIADSPVTLACKAHLRNERPVVLAVSSNDALAANAPSMGALLCRRHHYFVPFGQDDPHGKPHSLVAHMELLPETVRAALSGKQIQPLLR